MDDREYNHARRDEPSLDAAAAANDAPQDPVFTDAADMPAWMNEQDPGPVPAAGPARPNTLAWAASLVAVAVFVAGGVWLSKEYRSNNSLQVVAMSTPPEPARAQLQAAEAVIEERAPSTLPPLVLLPPEESAGAKAPVAMPDNKPAEVAPVPAPVLATPGPAPAVTRNPDKAPVAPVKAAKTAAPVVAAPVAAKTAAKAAAKAVPPKTMAKEAAAAPRKAIARTGARPGTGTRLAASKKRLIAARARQRPLAGTMLPPPRDRARDTNSEPAPRKRCHPGELARECLARTGAN